MELFSKIKKGNIKDICSICLDNKNIGTIIYQCNQCKKEFHKKCIVKWLNYKSECPYCRNKNDIDINLFEDLYIYNEFEWYNIEYHYNMSQYWLMIENIAKIIGYTFIIFILMFIYLLHGWQ